VLILKIRVLDIILKDKNNYKRELFTDYMDFEDQGREDGKIPVEISYKIIDLFSGGLYSSPNKAFEELVANSYDAQATDVSVYVPTEVTKDSFIWICDNGVGMNSEGLKWLWKIGVSNKRVSGYISTRKQIGKFGIGKLATYVLANKLTHLCKHAGYYRMVTMDYSKIPDDYQTIELSERLLSEDEAKEVIKGIIGSKHEKVINFKLFGVDSEESWTFVLMSNLKDKATKIRQWHLKWVLSTALPLNPGFNLNYNGTKLESSKVYGRVLKKWEFGKEDEVVDREDDYSSGKTEEGEYYVNIPGLNKFGGYIELYENSLVRGKSQDIGRSHGIFLLIRGRLINIDNPLLGDMRELNHAVFNRIRIIVHADGLDDNLTSGRESIKESEAFAYLQKYIGQKFNKVKNYFDKYVETLNKSFDTSNKLAQTSAILSKIPLLITIKRFFNNEIDNPYLINIRENLTDEEKNEFIDSFENSIIKGDEKIIDDISFDGNLSVEDPIAKLDVMGKKIFINTQHPFFVNLIPSLKSNLPFELIAINEILTESFLLEREVDQIIVRDVMEHRDKLFREFTYDQNPNAFAVALMLKNSLADSTGLEDSLFHCFRCLGFETTKIGGKGKPDGKSVARLGINPEDKQQQTYSFTYEAKSTKKDRIKAETSKISAVKRHRKDYNADYSVVVSINFEGAENQDSAVNKEAKQNKVSLIRAVDLWSLLINSIPNQLNFLEFREFLENCHTVPETKKWIEDFTNKTIEKKPIKKVLEVIWNLMEEDKIETPNVQAVRSRDQELMGHSLGEITSLIKSLELIVPNQIYLYKNGNVRLLTSPDKVMEYINKTIENEVPIEILEKFKTAFEESLNSD